MANHNLITSILAKLIVVIDIDKNELLGYTHYKLHVICNYDSIYRRYIMADKTKNNGIDETVVEEMDSEEMIPEESTSKRGKEAKLREDLKEGMETASKTINDAFKQVESLGKALGHALQDRANVVMVRVNNDSLRYLDMLVEADITNSRSESAAFLINEGIKANESLFNKIRDITDQIAALKSQLRQVVEVEE